MKINELYNLYKECSAMTTDSRYVPEKSMFFALKGESFDGNHFALAALGKGSAWAVVDDKTLLDEASDAQRERLIVVDDALQTLKDLARAHRRQFQIPVIGITGTNGKTTTKELIAAVLAEKYRVMFTQGNFNNDVGVPKTLLRLAPEHEIAVVEMGASHPGDIRTLVETAEPTCGLITNVGRAHLQGFGSFEGVKRTKGELYDYLASTGGFAFLNSRDADLCAMAEERKLSILPYTEGRLLRCNPYLVVGVDEKLPEIRLRLVGSYNLPNILAAISVGRHFGVSDEQIRHALENYTPSNNRSQLTVTERNSLVVDAYNANPSSMAAAIENFRMIETPMPKMAILGDMNELGDTSDSEHQAILTQLHEARFDEVWLVGEKFKKAAELCPVRIAHSVFTTIDEAKDALRQNPPAGRFILIKGSNSIKLYQLPEML